MEREDEEEKEGNPHLRKQGLGWGTLQRKGKEIQSPVFQRKRRKANARLWESGLRQAGGPREDMDLTRTARESGLRLEDLGKTWT